MTLTIISIVALSFFSVDKKLWLIIVRIQFSQGTIDAKISPLIIVSLGIEVVTLILISMVGLHVCY